MIKVILKEDVAGIGRTGDVKQVKDGFARNYLLPKDLALLATDQNLKKIETGKKKAEEKKALEKKKAQDMAERLANLSVTITAEASEEGKLYGSLTENDIARALGAEGADVDKRCIVLDAPIKELGIYDIELKLYPEVLSKIKVWVVKK